jgi:hypothetical protein
VRFEERIMIGAEALRSAPTVDGGVEHPAHVNAGHCSTAHADPDQATRELVHDHQHPVAPEHDGLAAKLVQAKSVGARANPIADRSPELSKTLFNWGRCVKKGDIDVARTEFELFISKKRTGGLVHLLPFAVEEAQFVSGVFRGPECHLLVKEAATEAALKAQPLSSYRILHLAAHGIMSTKVSARSALVLRPAGGEDRLPQAREILDGSMFMRVN